MGGEGVKFGKSGIIIMVLDGVKVEIVQLTLTDGRTDE